MSVVTTSSATSKNLVTDERLSSFRVFYRATSLSIIESLFADTLHHTALVRSFSLRRCGAGSLLRTQYAQLDEALSRWGVGALDRPKVEKIMRSTSFSSCVCAREPHRARLDERRPCAR